MAFSREDLTVYESKPQVEVDSKTFDPFNPEPPVKVEAVAESSAAVVPEPPVEEIDGSTTEEKAEPVAAEIANPEGDKDPEIDEPTDGRAPRNRAQERITELVDERNAVKEYNKYIQSKLDEALRMLQDKTAPRDTSTEKAPPAETDDAPPTLESVGFDPIELNKKTNEWIHKQVDKRVESAVKQIEVRQNENQVRQAFESRVAEFRKSAADFDTVLANPQLPQLSSEAARIVVRSEQGPAVAYHLAKNPDVAVRISKMDPMSQAAAIGRLEEQVARATIDAKNGTKEPSPTKAPVKVAAVTKAPPPPKPVSGGTAPVTKELGQMTMEEWVSHERGRKAQERQAKQKIRQQMR